MDLNNLELNKKFEDSFGRITGVFAVNKPIGKTSHDIVSIFRKKLMTKKVGHAGTLDPFASGILIILVGKATKLSDRFLTQDKEYIAEMLIGATSETGDPESEVTLNQDVRNFSEEEIKTTINSFKGEYKQFVPLYSSVKVNGDKLRVLARKFERFEITQDKEKRIVKFFDKDVLKKEVEIPLKLVKIYEIELISLKTIELGKLNIESFKKNTQEAQVATVRVLCSKGTYIRQLAVDLGEKLGTSAMLINLKRTKVGKIGMDSTIELEEIANSH